MPGLEKYFRENILLDKEKYQWLVKRVAELNVQVRRIASFGCGQGQETFALAWMLGASEAAGVDKEAQNVHNAHSTLKTIQSIIWAKGVPNEAPAFLKAYHLEQAVQFYQGDFVKRTQLLSDYYDIAFCDFVLYHIWLDQGGESKTQEAVNEMTRVVRPGGIIATREPTQRTGKLTFNIDFKPAFNRAGLKLVYMGEVKREGNNDETKYLCMKEGVA